MNQSMSMNSGNMSSGNMNSNMSLTEEDLLNDLLSQEKQMVSSYGTLICEASCPNLRSVMNNNLNSSIQDQYQIFDQMRSRGWYPTKDAQDADVQQAKQKIDQVKSTIMV